MTLKSSDAKVEEKLTCCLENDMRNLTSYSRLLESVKIGTLMGSFRKQCMTLKRTEELCVMTMKNDTKIEEKLTCHFKTDMRNLMNFDSSTRKSKKIAL